MDFLPRCCCQNRVPRRGKLATFDPGWACPQLRSLLPLPLSPPASPAPTSTLTPQVFISYGPVPNLKLLVYYGFAVPSNPHDLVPLQLEVSGGGVCVEGGVGGGG